MRYTAGQEVVEGWNRTVKQTLDGHWSVGFDNVFIKGEWEVKPNLTKTGACVEGGVLGGQICVGGTGGSEDPSLLTHIRQLTAFLAWLTAYVLSIKHWYDLYNHVPDHWTVYCYTTSDVG